MSSSIHSSVVMYATALPMAVDGTVAREAPPPFPELFRTYTPYVWRLLRRLGVAERDVADLAQDVFLTVHTHLDRFEGRSHIRTWIYGICVNRARDYLRLARVRRELPTDELPDRHEDASQDRDLDKKNALKRLDAMLSRLDDEKRTVFVLFDVESMPMEDVARVMDCPLQTAYSRLYAARSELKSMADAQRMKEVRV